MNVQALLNEASLHQNNGDIATAIACLERVLEYMPNNVQALNSLGALLYGERRFIVARNLFIRAVRAAPDQALSWTNLGSAHHELGDFKRAIDCHRRAIRLDPEYATAFANLGNTYDFLQETELAVYARRQALNFSRTAANMRSLARSYRAVGRYDRCRNLLLEAKELDPANIHVHFDLALVHLCLEEWQQGFDEYEWRYQRKEMDEIKELLADILDKPQYSDQDLSEATLLLYTEQGYGDNMLFARFVNMIRPQVGRLIMYCRPGLGRLFESSLPLDEVVENTEALPEFDYQLPLLSIPRAFDLDTAFIHKPGAYLAADTDDQDAEVIGSTDVKVGLVWSVSDTGYDYRNKKIPLGELTGLIDTPGVQFYSLQVGDDSTEIDEAGLQHKLLSPGTSLNDFADTARVVESLDLVISVDTSVAHLTGAMNKKVWVVAKKEPYWVWQADGDRCAWYPSARVYRQFSPGVWADVIRRLERDLLEFVEERQDPT